MIIIDGCIKLHQDTAESTVNPHFDADGYLHITSAEQQWDKLAEVINEWVDVDPTPRCAYVAMKLGTFLSQMYTVQISQPRPAYNIVMSKGVVPYDGTIAARYMLYMPGKLTFQNSHLDPSWTGLLSLANDPYIDPIYFDLLDEIWMLRDKEHIRNVHIGGTYYGRTTSPRLVTRVIDGEVSPLLDGDEILHPEMEFMIHNTEVVDNEYRELSQMLGETPDHEDTARWARLMMWLSSEKSRPDQESFVNYAKAWYGLSKYREIKEASENIQFIAKVK